MKRVYIENWRMDANSTHYNREYVRYINHQIGTDLLDDQGYIRTMLYREICENN